MKLLFDQNILFKIIRKLEQDFPEAKQVRLLGLEDFKVRKIWEYAREHAYAIVTFDADFYDLSNLFGHPPKIIWLRTGNTRTGDITQLLIKKKMLIQEFLSNEEHKKIACIESE